MSFKHLSLLERELLYGKLAQGQSLRSIACELGRSHTALSRELKRNTKYGNNYIPCLAEKRAIRVSLKQRYQAPLKNPQIFLYVREHLRAPYFWTPQMISGRIGKDIRKASIAIETIYQYIYSKKAHKAKLWEYLPCGRRKRRKKYGRKVHNAGRIPNAVSIDVRPKSVDNRKIPGHHETDNIEGVKGSKPALSVSVERVARYITIVKLKDSSAEEKVKALSLSLANLPQILRLSVTSDNGKENTKHEFVTSMLGTKMYFCHAYHSWEKGAVENRNRVIRRFFPKGTDFTGVSDESIKFIETIINNMPMECLNYSTPYEKMAKLITKATST